MSGFWNLWIVGLTTLNVAFAVWLFLATSSGKKGDQKPGAETTGHTWDGDLAEYNNPLPRWWLGIFYASVAFAVVYLALFPGLGVFSGSLGWSSANQWRAQTDQANALYAREFSRFDAMPIVELQKDDGGMRIARNLFAANCAMCHAFDGRGAKGFPDLTSPNLTYGRDPEAVIATIGGGRQGVMPAWKDILGADGVAQVANYVYSLSGGSADASLAAAGKERFATICAACHGPDGTGNTTLGAPNLTDRIWIYGGTLDAIKETISKGRTNKMPAHLDLLGPAKVRLLAAYVLSLSPAPATPAATVPTAAAAAATPATANAAGT